MSENSNMLLGVKDKPPAVNWILLAIQHVCAMFGATILVPIVVNTTVGSDVLSIPVALVTSGIGTSFTLHVLEEEVLFIWEVHLHLLHQW